jgi:SAM-dependent methyltransferase
MSDWQERITRETAPAIRAEHDLRYRIAAPLVLAGGPWADLGCGNGVAAAAALGPARPAHAVLVDVEEAVVERAGEELALPEATLIAGDLTNPGDLERIGAALGSFGGEPLITCFEVVEHLSTFLPLLEWSTSMARDHRTTFVLSVPNDAFWSIQNPYHLTSWGEGAFEELSRLLPADRTLLRQVALSGSALCDWQGAPDRHRLDVEVGGDGMIATHFIAAFGPRHREVRRSAMAVQTDMLEQRRWERERESDLALAQRQVIEQREELQKRTIWFEQWRTYIHELERELKRPLSGASEDELPENPDGGALAPGLTPEPTEPGG